MNLKQHLYQRQAQSAPLLTMEIAFIPPGQPGRFLNLYEASKANLEETIWALQSALSTIMPPNLSPENLLSSIQNVRAIESRFYGVLVGSNYDSLTDKEKKIIRAARDGIHYTDDDIEGVFYKYGGYHGIIAAILLYRTGKINRQEWISIPQEFREGLVKRVTNKLNSKTCENLDKWIKELNSQHIQMGELTYLGKNAGRKRKRGQSVIPDVADQYIDNFVKIHVSPQFALVSQDLWTTDDEHIKIEFFVNRICARRTVFTYKDSNSYTMLVPDKCEGVRQMLFALCCTYLKVCVPSESRKYAIHEGRHFGEAIKFLCNNLQSLTHVDSILKIVWLLVHYHVVSNDSSEINNWSVCSQLIWILQSKGICINYKWTLFPAYESVVKFTGLRNKMIANERIDMKEFENCSHPSPCHDLNCRQEYSMVRDLGCSKELLVAMGLINDIEVKTYGFVDDRVKQGHALMDRIKAIEQWTMEPLRERADIAMKIARSFHLTAQINVMVQLLGYTPNHPQLQMLGDKLALLILEIPDGSESYKMDLFTMQHPLQPHFQAIFCSPNYGIQCLHRLQGIYNRSTTTNTGLPLDVAKQILQWQAANQQNDIEHGWIWRMKQGINLKDDLSLG